MWRHSMQEEWFDSSAHRTIVWLTAIAGIAIRLYLMVAYAKPTDPYLWEFGIVARNLFEHGTFAFFEPTIPSAYMPPRYPFLIYLLYLAFGITPTAHVVLAAVLFAACMSIPFMVRAIAGKLWGRTAGFVAFVLSMFWPHLLIMSGRLNNIPLYTALLVAVCAVLIAADWRLPVRAVVAGLLLGLYATMRWEGGVYAIPVGLWLLRQAGVSIRQRTIAIIVFGAAFTVPMAPWLVRNYVVYDRIVLSSQGWLNILRGHWDGATGTARPPWPAAIKEDLTQGGAAATGMFPGTELLWSKQYTTKYDEFEVNTVFRRHALDFITNNPGREVLLAAKKLFYFNVADFTHPVDRLWPIWLPSLTALLIGLVFWLRSGLRDPSQQLLWTLYLFQLGLAMAFHVVPRYRMIVVFIPILFLSTWVSQWLMPRLLRRISVGRPASEDETPSTESSHG